MTLERLHEQVVAGSVQVERVRWRLLLPLNQAIHSEFDFLVRFDHVFESLTVAHVLRTGIFVLFDRRDVLDIAAHRAIVVALLRLISAQAIQVCVHDDLLLHGLCLDGSHQCIINSVILVHV